MNDCARDYLHEPNSNSTLRHMARSSVLRVSLEAAKMLLVFSNSLVTGDLWNLEYVWRNLWPEIWNLSP